MRAASHQGQELNGSVNRPDTFTRNVLVAYRRKRPCNPGADHTFERISRSIVSRRISRRNLVSSSRSGVVRPPSPTPVSRSARLIQQRIAHVEHPNSFDNCECVRPPRNNSTICRRNSGVYLGFDFDILSTSLCDTDVSTKAGQVHSPAAPINARRASSRWSASS